MAKPPEDAKKACSVVHGTKERFCCSRSRDVAEEGSTFAGDQVERRSTCLSWPSDGADSSGSSSHFRHFSGVGICCAVSVSG